MKTDYDKERGRSSTRLKRKHLLVNPLTLKAILTIAPWVANILRLGIELVKLFKQ